MSGPDEIMPGGLLPFQQRWIEEMEEAMPSRIVKPTYSETSVGRFIIHAQCLAARPTASDEKPKEQDPC
jgi:hypothetical protein